MTTEPRDAEHLRLLVIGHYVGAGLSLLGIAFLAVHGLIFMTVFKTMPAQQPGGGPALDMSAFEAMMPWLYGFGGALFLTCGILNLASARCIAGRRARTFSIVVAGLNCMHMPLGAALGVMTIIVLTRDSVRTAYGE